MTLKNNANFMLQNNPEDEVQLRARWRALVDERLPRAAADRTDWPVHLNHCFARILLDNAVGKMWRDAIKPPAWRNTPVPILQKAIDLGEDVLAGHADLWVLNDTSLALRGKPPLRVQYIKGDL